MRMRFYPKPARGHYGIDRNAAPPSCFIAAPMGLAVMTDTAGR